MTKLRKAALVIVGLALVTVLASCSRTKQDITVERHTVGEEFVVE